jgi:2-iminobutanoate/2-iminopropanoate deaminase
MTTARTKKAPARSKAPAKAPARAKTAAKTTAKAPARTAARSATPARARVAARPAARSAKRREVITVSEGHMHTSPIPQGIKAGGFIFLSALRGIDPVTQVPVKGTEEQIRRLFENMKLVLKAAGATLDDVVKIAVYMRDLQGGRPIFNKVWAEYFPKDPPARFAVQVMDMGGPNDGSMFLADVTALAK